MAFFIKLCIIIITLPLCHSFAENLENDALIVTLKVNYIDSDNFSIVLKDSKNHLLIPFDDIRQFNVKEDYLLTASLEINNVKYINLDSLPGVRYHVDDETLDLNIIFPIDSMQAQHFNAIDNPDKVISGTPISGAFLNYDITYTDNSESKSLAGFQDFNYFSEYGVLSHSFVMRSGPIGSNFKRKKHVQRDYDFYTRLDTNWTFDNVEEAARWRIGDSITKAADWSNSTRFAGIQYATNFSVRPNLITHPLLNFEGKAELPTTFDVFANSSAIYHGESQIGEFDIANLPAISGRGDLTVKTQDITGKIQTITIPYYISPTLLSKGLSDYSFGLGVQRKNFALKSNQYQDFVVSADYMRGITNSWTSGFHIESIKNLATIGTTNNFQIGNYGVISTSVASNLHQIKNAQKFSIGYSYNSTNFDFNTIISKNSRNYYDIYNYPTPTSSEVNYQASIGYNDSDLGSISLNFLSFAVDSTKRKSKRLQMISTTYQTDIKQSGFFNITAGTDLNRKHKHNFVYMTLGMSLGGAKSVSLSNSIQDKYNTKQLNFSSPITTPLGYGYSANLIRSKNTNYNLQFNKNSEIGNASLYLYKYDKHLTKQLEFKGSVVLLDKNLYFTQPINNSLALVKVGELKGVGVYNNNLIIGHTNEQGKILIPNVLAYIPSEIRLDEETLPLDTEFDDISLNVAPKWKEAVKVDFGVTIINSVEMILVDENKKLLPFDETVTIENIDEELFVGYLGTVYIHNIKQLNILKGKSCGENGCCHFVVPINNDFTASDAVLDLGEVICK